MTKHTKLASCTPSHKMQPTVLEKQFFILSTINLLIFNNYIRFHLINRIKNSYKNFSNNYRVYRLK